jgi:hypothetical protein
VKGVCLYAVTSVEATANTDKGLQGYEPDWHVGQILVSDDQGPEWVFGPSDNVATVTVSAAFVGRGLENSEGTITYTQPVARLLALVQLGAQQEVAVRDAVLLFAEEIREQVIDEPVQAIRLSRLDGLLRPYLR